MLRDWVRLSRAPGIGPRKIRTLLERFGTPEEIFCADEAALSLAGLSPKEIASLQDADPSEADAILERCYEKHISLMTLQAFKMTSSLSGTKSLLTHMLVKFMAPIPVWLNEQTPLPTALSYLLRKSCANVSFSSVILYLRVLLLQQSF